LDENITSFPHAVCGNLKCFELTKLINTHQFFLHKTPILFKVPFFQTVSRLVISLVTIHRTPPQLFKCHFKARVKQEVSPVAFG